MGDKLVTLPILNYYKSKSDQTYVGQEDGKRLIEEEKITKLDSIADNAQVNVIESIEVDGVSQTIDESKKVTLDLSKYTTDEELVQKLQEFAVGGDMGAVLDNYLKKEDIDTELNKYSTDAEVDSKLQNYTNTETLEEKYLKIEDIEQKFEHYTTDDEFTQTLQNYATKQSVQDLEALVNKVGTYKGATVKNQLAVLKDTANKCDIYTITDDENHAYIFCGIEQAGLNGVDENGFLDIGGHIDLSGIETELANTKADVKKKLETQTFEEYQHTVEETYVKQVDFDTNLVYCTNDDIDAMFSDGE